jgi:hypothetical protein
LIVNKLLSLSLSLSDVTGTLLTQCRLHYTKKHTVQPGFGAGGARTVTDDCEVMPTIEGSESARSRGGGRVDENVVTGEIRVWG